MSNQQPPPDMDRSMPTAELSSRRAPLPEVTSSPTLVPETTATPSAEPDDATLAVLGRRVWRELQASPTPPDPDTQWRAEQQARIAATEVRQRALVTEQGAAVEVLRDELARAQAAYDSAFAVWESSPARLSMLQADAALEVARMRLTEQQQADREALAPLQFEIEHIRHRVLQRDQERLRCGPGFVNWRRADGQPEDPEDFSQVTRLYTGPT